VFRQPETGPQGPRPECVRYPPSRELLPRLGTPWAPLARWAGWTLCVHVSGFRAPPKRGGLWSAQGNLGALVCPLRPTGSRRRALPDENCQTVRARVSHQGLRLDSGWARERAIASITVGGSTGYSAADRCMDVTRGAPGPALGPRSGRTTHSGRRLRARPGSVREMSGRVHTPLDRRLKCTCKDATQGVYRVHPAAWLGASGTAS
jgi:hypothetical protein